MAEAVETLAARYLSAHGDIWECGVYRGQTAQCLAALVAGRQPRVLRLFDTFAGRPADGPEDAGCSTSRFDDTTVARVRARMPQPFVCIHEGVIPEMFRGLESSQIAFAYVDLDLYAGTRDALAFILPRLTRGGAVLIDDYDEPRVWPGVRRAVDELGRPVRRVGRRALIEAEAPCGP